MMTKEERAKMLRERLAERFPLVKKAREAEEPLREKALPWYRRKSRTPVMYPYGPLTSIKTVDWITATDALPDRSESLEFFPVRRAKKESPLTAIARKWPVKEKEEA